MKPTFFATPAELRAWFEANHESAKELLVGFYKRGSGKPSITWPESVDEALCFGWIDGVRKSIDEDAYTIRFTPRKPTSIWSAINVAKVAALEKLGRMRPAGRAAFAKRKPERTGVYSFERSVAAELSADELRELRASGVASAFFDAQPPWYRRTATHWVISAKRAETRRRRFEHLLSQSASGRTIGPLTRNPSSAAEAPPAAKAPRVESAPRAAKVPRGKKTPSAAGTARGKKVRASEARERGSERSARGEVARAAAGASAPRAVSGRSTKKKSSRKKKR